MLYNINIFFFYSSVLLFFPSLIARAIPNYFFFTLSYELILYLLLLLNALVLLRKKTIVLFIVFFLITLIPYFLYSNNFFNYLIGVRFYLKIMAFMSIAYIVMDKIDMAHMSKVFKYLVFILVVAAIMQLILGNYYIVNIGGTFTKSIVDTTLTAAGGLGQGRLPLVGLLGNYNSFGLVALFLFLIYFYSNNSRERTIYLVLLFFFIVFSYSRASFILFLIFIFLNYFYFFNLKKKISLISLFLIIIIIYYFSIFTADIDISKAYIENGFERVLYSFNYNNLMYSISEKARLWLVSVFGIQVNLDYGFLGAGVAKYGNKIIYISDPEIYIRYGVNLAFDNDSSLGVMLAQIGFFGILFLFFIINIYYKKFIVYKEFRYPLLILLFFMSFISVGFFDTLISLLFFLYLPVFIYVYTKTYKGEKCVVS